MGGTAVLGVELALSQRVRQAVNVLGSRHGWSVTEVIERGVMVLKAHSDCNEGLISLVEFVDVVEACVEM